MNIDGVRVLSQEAIIENPEWVAVIAIFLFVCTIIFMVLAFITFEDWLKNIFIFVSSLLLIWIIFAGAIGIFNKPSDCNTYKCIFEEDVSIQKIYEKYDVVGREGEIWILEDKE